TTRTIPPKRRYQSLLSAEFWAIERSGRVLRSLIGAANSTYNPVFDPSREKPGRFLRRFRRGQIREGFTDCRERLARDHLTERSRLSLVHRRMKDAVVIRAPDAD